MSYSAYFAARSEHYRKLAIAEPNGWRAEYRLGLANLFLQMFSDMLVRERRQAIAAALADEKAVTAKPHATLLGSFADRQFGVIYRGSESMQ